MALTHLPLGHLENDRIVGTLSSPTEERAKLLWLSWDLMDADQQDQLLLAAEAILDRRRRVTVRAGRSVSPDLADGEPTAATVAIEIGPK